MYAYTLIAASRGLDVLRLPELELRPSTVLDSGVMKTASIGALFGDAGTPTMVSPS